MAHGPFHRPSGIPLAERQAANIREYIGDGTPELRVPGLTKVTQVVIGRVNIPLEQDYKFPNNSDFAQKVHTTLPVIALDVSEDGCPILLRSTHSNDGIWQDGHKIYVGGEWEDDEPKAEASAAPRVTEPKPSQQAGDTPKELPSVVEDIMKLNIEQMRVQAKAAGIEDFGNMKKLDLAKALAKAAGYPVE